LRDLVTAARVWGVFEGLGKYFEGLRILRKLNEDWEKFKELSKAWKRLKSG
jgi:hypothetical protein